jgi:hypothetical protein
VIERTPQLANFAHLGEIRSAIQFTTRHALRRSSKFAKWMADAGGHSHAQHCGEGHRQCDPQRATLGHLRGWSEHVGARLLDENSPR